MTAVAMTVMAAEEQATIPTRTINRLQFIDTHKFIRKWNRTAILFTRK